MEFKKVTYSSQAAEYIRELIRAGRIQPGQPVRESMISDELGISRAPIREALLLLAEQGLVCSEPHKGKYVHSMSAGEIYDSYMVAGILEGAGVAQAVLQWGQKEKSGFAGAEEIVTRIQPDADPDMLAAIDEKFHMTLLSACPNARLVSLARTSCASIAKFLYYRDWIQLFTPRQYRQRHLLVAQAVRSGDPVLIEKTIRLHYEETGRLLSQAVCL